MNDAPLFSLSIVDMILRSLHRVLRYGHCRAATYLFPVISLPTGLHRLQFALSVPSSPVRSSYDSRRTLTLASAVYHHRSIHAVLLASHLSSARYIRLRNDLSRPPIPRT